MCAEKAKDYIGGVESVFGGKVYIFTRKLKEMSFEEYTQINLSKFIEQLV